jgi:alpha-L-fucosidase
MENNIRKHAGAAPWYMGGKFGIFIHWGPASVPGWAPQTTMNTQEMIREKGLTYYFMNNPYSEWYRNTMQIPGSPTQQYHQQTYGDLQYEGFGPMFLEQSSRDNYEYLSDWALLFAQAGAKYVVPVSKHHDGFTLWPTKIPPHDPGWTTNTDIIGKIHDQVVTSGMHFGVYYSGLYDWSWNKTYIQNCITAALNGLQLPGIVSYMDGHVKELIDNYQPEVLWNDIGYVTHGSIVGPVLSPFKTQQELFDYYYNAVAQGNIDDRWWEIPADTQSAYRLLSGLSLFFTTQQGQQAAALIDTLLKQNVPGYDKPPNGLSFPTIPNCDYHTKEYEVPNLIQDGKWELVRGIGLSFCYNRNEDPSVWLTYNDLVIMFVDVIAKNGNLLLNVGPMADGTLQDHETALLQNFGSWMNLYGNAVYDTIPWLVIPDDTYTRMPYTFQPFEHSIPLPLIRFTVKDNILNVFFNNDGLPSVFVPDVWLQESSTVSLTGGGALAWQQQDSGISVSLPSTLPPGPFRCINIFPVPQWTGTK